MEPEASARSVPVGPPGPASSGWLLVLFAAMLWGTTGTVQALAPPAATSAQIGAVRLVVGGGLLLAYAAHRQGGSGLRAGLRRGTWPLTVTGAAALAAYQLLFFAGLRTTGVAVGTLVALGSAPILTAVLGLVLGERVRRVWAVATGLVLAGLVLLLLPGADDPSQLLGLLMALGAGLGYAVYTVIARLLLRRGVAGDAVVGLCFPLAAVPLLALQLRGDVSWLLSWQGLATAGWLGVAATAVSYWLWIRGLAHIHAATAATVSLAEPATATVLAVLVLGESVTGWGVAGMAAVVAGLVVLARAARSGR